MPKQATGEVWLRNGVWVARITLRARERVTFPLSTARSESQAVERAAVLSSIAKRLRLANIDAERACKVLEMCAAAKTDRDLRDVQTIVEELAGGKCQIAGVKQAPTFKEIGERWTSGKLAKQYPDQIRSKRSADDDESRLRIYIYPVIGSVPIDRVTLDACEEVMRKLPTRLAVATRRNIGQLITRIMSMAVYPLRLIASTPVPAGFLPAAPKQKALAHLYPSEDARLMAASQVPLAYRLLWGFLMREGVRLGEALALTWADLDLERGAIRIDKNKTDDPRAWAMQRGVASALRVFRERFRSAPTSADLVFLDHNDQRITESGALGLPPLLRTHLKAIGLHSERPELFVSTPERRQMRVHDLRGTFVTVGLANGRSESWIADRTGHKSSLMIARYKRTARTFAELQTGDFEPLDIAIPELTAIDSAQPVPTRGSLIAHGLPTSRPNYARSIASPAGFEPASPT